MVVQPGKNDEDVILDVFSKIGGKWKVRIICTLAKDGEQQFNQLLRSLDGISAHILSQQLREMVEDGLVFRMDIKNDAPKIILYALTRKGASLIPVLETIGDWGVVNVLNEKGKIVIDGFGLTGYPQSRHRDNEL
jgi:DNA-binding HxlR family transcriptional regulator